MSSTNGSSSLIARGRAVQWTVMLGLATELWRNARRKVEDNLTAEERSEFVAIVRKSKGRPSNLTREEQSDLPALVKKAATGRKDSSWGDTGRAAMMILPPEVFNRAWRRIQAR
jgi:hypothetical protein